MKSLRRCVDLLNRNEVSTSSAEADFIEGVFMKENKLADLSMNFAINALRLADEIEGHYALKNQFERSSTSIGANLREANYAQSTADFLSKLQISLKECYETEYWLELFIRSNILPDEKVKTLLHDCGEIRRILVSSVNTLKSK